jgi:dUTP pyrophosphatase
MISPVEIKVRRLAGTEADWPLPAYATQGAAGADVQAHLPQGSVTLAPGGRALIPTGLAFEIPAGYEVQMRPRSGLALKQGIVLANAPGTIDSDYRGEVGVILLNAGTEAVEITHGMRIAQMIVAPAPQARLVEADRLSDTARGAAGFGSTGVF